MLARALIVLLLVLNLGVALWWATRGEPAPPAPDAVQQQAGVDTLRLLREIPPGERPEPRMSRPAPQAAADPETCLAFGPFDDQAKAEAARARLQPMVARLHVRKAAAAPARDWRVWLPPLADRAAAQAMAARVAAAGFKDYFIVSGGADANGIALGLFRSEEAARRHEAALRAAGFANVRSEPMGVADVTTWIDVAAPASFDPAAARAALGTVGVEALDCASVP